MTDDGVFTYSEVGIREQRRLMKHQSLKTHSEFLIPHSALKKDEISLALFIRLNYFFVITTVPASGIASK